MVMFTMVFIQKPREGWGCPKFLDGKVFRQISMLLEIFIDFPAARHAIPAKVWAFSGKENGCWKIGPAFGNAPGMFSFETATGLLEFSDLWGWCADCWDRLQEHV